MEFVSQILQYRLLTLGDSTFTVGQIVYVLLLILIGILLIRWSARLLQNHMERRQTNPDLMQIIGRAWWIVAIAILALSVLELLNVPLTAFAFISGAIAIGVGFGAQNIINNFISGWILMWERPIRIGDFLEVGDMKGSVEAIYTRFTRIRRVDGVHMLVPNSHLLENTVINWTLVDKLTRTTVTVGVSYGSPVERVAELLSQAAQEDPGVLKDPVWSVMFEDFGDNALVFNLLVWTHARKEGDLREIRSSLRFRIYALFNADDIVIAFPQRDLHLDGELLVRKEPSESASA